MLPGFLGVTAQQELILGALQETTGPASRTNLDSHYHPPPSGWWGQYVQAPQHIVQTKAATEGGTEGAKTVSERVKIDLKPMDKSNFVADQATQKEDPAPSTTVQPSPVEALIRKLRWTIIGLEYHASLAGL